MVIRLPIPRALLALLRDRKGVSAVEFALVLPLLLLLYAGSVELSEALSVDRKVNQLASSVGDLVTQEATMNRTLMDNIFAATTAIMQPYPTAPVQIMVAAVNIQADGSQVVSWAEVQNDDDPPSGGNSPVAIPADIATPGSQVIIARSRYEFTSPFSDFMSTITGRTSYQFEHVFIMRPRQGSTITWQ